MQVALTIQGFDIRGFDYSHPFKTEPNPMLMY
jgi:hypothetical protein